MRRKNGGWGTAAAFGAYAMWGVFPLYWKQLKTVESLQVLSHRIVWAAAFCFILMTLSRRLGEAWALFRNAKKIGWVVFASLLATSNWGLYIWAVNSGRVMESALGYYINPLLSVAFGAVFFRERVDAWTRAAVALAAAGILGAAAFYGSVPWISLLLAITFAAYGAVKKRLAVEPLLGLSVETLVSAPLALAFLFIRHAAGAGAFLRGSPAQTALLVLSGAVTAIPLILFAAAANTISLQKMGFIQYVSPTGQLILGMAVFGERPTAALLVAFAGVLGAVVIYVSTRNLPEKGPGRPKAGV
ncbi:MAG TPA: EamA family transporter RarD [Rectinemataceae bacterium]